MYAAVLVHYVGVCDQLRILRIHETPFTYITDVAGTILQVLGNFFSKSGIDKGKSRMV